MKAVALALSLLSLNAWAISKEDIGALNELFIKTIEKNEKRAHTGVAVSVFTANEIIMQKGYGFADAQKETPVTNRTAFAIGSTTKAFTSLGLKLLENEGHLKLTDKVSEHLIDFQLANQKISEQVTIEDLLSHRIGLPRHDFAWYLTDFTQDDLYSRLKYYNFPDGAEEKFRKTFEYNNLMYMVAGKVIEESSGKSWPDYIQQAVLNPLEMKDTSFGKAKSGLDVATPYLHDKAIAYKEISNIASAGNMYSTTTDMTKWIQSFLQKKWKGIDDLTNARIALDNENPDLKYGYALGWMTNTMNPKASWIFHGGNIDGFSAMVLFSYELNVGIVVLVNDNGSDLNDLLVTDLLRYELSRKPVDKDFNSIKKRFLFPKLDQSNLASLSLNTKSEKVMDEVTLFENPGYGVLKTFSKDGKDYLAYFKNVWEIKEMVDDTFNYSLPLEIAGQIYEYPMLIEQGKISIPFQPGTPLVEFSLTKE